MKNLLFICFCFFVLLPAFMFKPCAGAASATNTKIVLQASAGAHIPIMSSGSTWNNYGFGGFLIEIPSTLKNMNIRLSADAGKMRSNSFPDIELNALQSFLGCSYNIQILPDLIAIKPLAGFSSLSINPNKFRLDRKIFNNGESENGFCGGIEPTFSFKHLRISMPIYATYIFCSPVPFNSVSASINAGAAF